MQNQHVDGIFLVSYYRRQCSIAREFEIETHLSECDACALKAKDAFLFVFTNGDFVPHSMWWITREYMQQVLQARQLGERLSWWRRFFIRALALKISLGNELKDGWTAPTMQFIFWCPECRHYSKDYMHSVDLYMVCYVCGIQYCFRPFRKLYADPAAKVELMLPKSYHRTQKPT